MKKGLLLLLMCLGASLAHAQAGYLFSFSYMAIDPGTGMIAAYGYTTMVANAGGVSYLDASVQTGIVGQGQCYAENNPSLGTARCVAYGQVPALNQTYTEYSGHYGAVYDDYGFWNGYQGTTDSKTATAPTVSLQSINCNNPRGCIWTYNVYGGTLFAFSLQSTATVQYSYGPTFTLDQATYADQDSWRFVGYVYGLPVYDQPIYGRIGCSVAKTNGISIPGAHYEPVLNGDGEIGKFPPQAISIVHLTANVASTVTYCIPPTAGSLTTAVTDSDGAVCVNPNPQGNCVDDPNTDDTIEVIGENQIWPGAVLPLGPETRPTSPPQGPQFRASSAQWGWTQWFSDGTPTSVCNTGIQFDTGFVAHLLSNCNNGTLP